MLDLNRLRLLWSGKHRFGCRFHMAALHLKKLIERNLYFTKGIRRKVRVKGGLTTLELVELSLKTFYGNSDRATRVLPRHNCEKCVEVLKTFPYPHGRSDDFGLYWKGESKTGQRLRSIYVYCHTKRLILYLELMSLNSISFRIMGIMWMNAGN